MNLFFIFTWHLFILSFPENSSITVLLNEVLFYCIIFKGAGGSQTENIILCYFFRGQKILIVAGFIEFSKSQNTYNYLAAARFTRDYLKILNFDTKNLSSPTVFEQET